MAADETLPGGWRDIRVLRTAGVRVAAAYVTLFAISTLTLIVFLWWATAGLLNRQVELAIHTDVQVLSERWEEGGVTALVETLNERLSDKVDDDAIYLLVDSTMEPVVGNLAHWPHQTIAPLVSTEIMIAQGERHGLARVRRFDLTGGYKLLVGRDVRVRARLQRLLADTLLWTLALGAGLGCIGAIVVRNLFRRMLNNVSAIAQAISAGDLSRRVRLSGRGDEFDLLAETINDMLDRIGRLMDGVRQVSNAIAHDLRTPITRARTRLEDAALHAVSRDELENAVARAITDLDGVVAVFEALLRIAEIEAGARRSAFARLDLAEVLRDLAELYEAVAEERGLELRVDLPAHLWVTGDRELIQQAVANLLDNALKFSPVGGNVYLRADQQAGTRIVVQDGGPGIPEADMGRATQRFFRGETARSTPGSGLGLSLVQAVAHLHGGVLALEDAHPGLRAVLTISHATGKPSARTALPAPEATGRSSGGPLSGASGESGASLQA